VKQQSKRSCLVRTAVVAYFTKKKKTSTGQNKKCRIERSNLKTGDMIMYCPVRAITQLGEGVTDEYGAWWHRN
jgi:glutamine cyclotransferase